MRKLNITYLVSGLILMSGFVSCSDNDNNTGNENNQYITLMPQIRQQRVSGNSFEANDAIGVFVVPYENNNTTSGVINQSTYAPNVEFIYNGSAWNTSPDDKISWPSSGRIVDIYGYYPYDETVSVENSREYNFSINDNQQTKVGYETSDLLWARHLAVSPTRDPVELTFFHVMSKIRVNVKTEIENIAQQLPEAIVTVINTKKSAGVDLETGSPSVNDLADNANVTTFRHSSPAEGYLLSTEGILIPQTINAGVPFLHIDIPTMGTRYTYTPTQNISMESGRERTFNITITQLGLSVSVGLITDWQVSDIIEGEIGKPIPKILDLNEIDWTKSLVQNIYDNGVQIGQVTREYLFKSNTVDVPAITVYAMGNDGQIDQSTGFVAQVMNRTRNATTNIYEPNTASIHGGTVVWADANMMASYTSGSQALFDKVEISSTGINSAASNAITTLNVAPYNMIDVDGNSYSVVKISSQYWMAENLKTEHYRNGEQLIYYYYNNNVSNKDIYGALYDWNTIMDSRNIGPEGWGVPVNAQFISLYQYLTPDAGRKLKSNILWINLNYNDNVTGFNGLPGGRRIDTGTYNEMYYYGQWWSSTATSTTLAYRLYLDYGNNAMQNTTLGKGYTQSIRLIRE